MKFFVLVLFSLFIWACSIKVQEKPLVQQKPAPTAYERAEQRTGVSSFLLHAIAIVESNENDAAIGDDGKSIGRMQLNEAFHKERAKKFGEYNPYDVYDATYIAGMIYRENYNILKDEYKAIAAYRQGVHGVQTRGADSVYVNKVLTTMLQLIFVELKNQFVELKNQTEMQKEQLLHLEQEFGTLKKLLNEEKHIGFVKSNL